MPIAKVQLQDGRIARFEVPDGTTPDEVMQFANNQFGEQQPQQTQPRTPTQPTQYVEKNIEPQPLSRLEAFGTIATNLPLTPRLYAGVAALEARRQALAENLKQTNDLQKSKEATRSISSFYDEALSNQLSKLRQAREQYPKQSFVTQLTADIIGPGRILKGLGLAGNTAKQALAGGSIIGGLTALGETRDISNLPQSLTDLGAGALLGGVGGVAGQQVGKALGKASQTLPQVIQRFKPNTPEKVLSKVITPEEAGSLSRKLSNILDNSSTQTIDKENILNSLNPTGSVFSGYSPEARMSAKLGKNITTLDKTSGKSADEIITIYRGAPKNQKEIVGGDFITTNKNLAQDYAGDGNVLSKKVKLKDILDDINEPLGEEYIYRPSDQSKIQKKIETRITALPEMGNESILGLTRLLGKTQGSNKVIADYINTKSATSTRRVANLINTKLSSENYFDNLDNIVNTRKELSAPLYEQAEQEFNQNVAKFLKPKFKNVVKNVESNIVDPTTGKNFITQKTIKEQLPLNKLYDNPAIDIYIRKAINDPKFADPRINKSSFQALQKAKEVVDSEMETSIGTTKRALGQIKSEIINVIEKFSPSYKEARNTYADLSALKSAQEEGLNIGKLRNGEEVRRYLETLTDGEKETYKIGVKDYLMDKAMKTGDANSSARKIFSQPLEREKIKAVFNNPKEFSDFAKRMNDEIRVFDTKQRIVGGSRTDFNIQEGAELLDKVAKGAVNAKTFGISNIILASADAIKKRYYGLNEQTAKELAIIIVNPQKSVEVLNRIYQKAQTPQEKMLIQKFAENLANRNFTSPISAGLGRSQATEQLKEENNNGI
jgi:hypothetical protein